VLSCRNKLTKLAGNKNERRKLSKQIQGLLQEEILGKAAAGKKQQQTAAAAADGMAE
jgi:predicted component of type VI protein secretion system